MSSLKESRAVVGDIGVPAARGSARKADAEPTARDAAESKTPG